MDDGGRVVEQGEETQGIPAAAVRRGHFGELVQMEGSFEDWLEDRGPRGCMIHMVDDATSTSLGRFAEEETTWGVADTLRAWVKRYGVPRALYVDWKSVYHQKPTERQKHEGIVPVSQFGRMCQKLGIELTIRAGGSWPRERPEYVAIRRTFSHEGAPAKLPKDVDGVQRPITTGRTGKGRPTLRARPYTAR